MPGTRITSPGPFTRQNRPSWNTTPRWYSRRTRSDDAASSTNRIRTIKGKANAISFSFRSGHTWHHAVDFDHKNPLPARQVTRGSNLPRLATNVRPADLPKDFQHLAVGPNHGRQAAHDRRPARLQRHPHHEENECRGDNCEERDQRPRNAETAGASVDQHQGANDKSDYPAYAERTVGRYKHFGNDETDAEDDQCEARVVHRKQVKRISRQQQAYRASNAWEDEARIVEFE